MGFDQDFICAKVCVICGPFLQTDPVTLKSELWSPDLL
jgi:hypothetical protein